MPITAFNSDASFCGEKMLRTLFNRHLIGSCAKSLAFLLLANSTLAATEKFPAPSELPSHEELPDPLVAFDGSKASTPQLWKIKRKPELKELFEHYMYGRYPARPEHVTGKKLFEDPAAFDGKGTLREVELTFGPAEWPKIYLLIATPNGAMPAACFVGPNFAGNHLATDDRRVRLPQAWMPEKFPGVVNNRATDEGRGKGADTWPLADIVGRGYAVATFYCGDVQPDRPAVREGVRATLGEKDDDPTQTGTIMWWAWGVHRAVDYLATDKAIDPKRLAVVGHSRLGKTALLAGAFDDRVALTIAHQAGCGGSGPSRHHDPKAETVKRITTAFPHWFCGNFKAFGDDTTKLPLDQHELVDLCAPRPVLFTAAADDLWSNPSGQFEVLKAATPVYELLGVDGLKAVAMPKPEEPLVDSRLGYGIRPGKHSMTSADWKMFMAFSDKWLK
jgi:hypothetical protein